MDDLDNRANSILKQLAALKLEILGPVLLNKEQIIALLLGQQNPETSTVYHQATPMVIAEFKQSALEAILPIVRGIKDLIDRCVRKDKEPADWSSSVERHQMDCFAISFAKDIQKIHNVVFDISSNEFSAEYEAGLFDHTRFPSVHTDVSPTHEVSYVARLFNFPIEYVKKPDDTTREVLRLIQQSQFMDCHGGHRAREILRALHVLYPLPLNHVILMRTKCKTATGWGVEEDLHCSSYVAEPDYSVFLRSSYPLKNANNSHSFT